MASLTLAQSVSRTALPSGLFSQRLLRSSAAQVIVIRHLATSPALGRNGVTSPQLQSERGMVKIPGQGHLAIRHDSGLSIIGAGLAATAVGGACGGVGQIWSAYLLGHSRNPSLAANLRTDAFMGVAVVEVMLLIALGFAGYLSSR